MNPRLFLSLADIEHALTLAEPSQVFLRDVVLALPLLEGYHIDALVVDELIDIANEPSSASPPSSITQDFHHRSRYAYRGLRSSTGPRTHRASSSYNQGTFLPARPESTYTTRASPYTSSV
jgi:hypothetical protein